MPLLEIACFDEESAITAASSGASRIELCTNANAGGTTPPLAVFQSLKSNTNIRVPIYVMIRPHGLSFTYTSSELKQMKEEIETYKREGADGFVFGILTEEGRVDEESCRGLLEIADGRPCTFHRAFDEMREADMEGELEVLVKCGFENVLTSGGKKSAVEGIDVLRKLVEKANGRIEIIVGGGVRSTNLEILRNSSGGSFHSSAIVSSDGKEVASSEEVKVLSELVNDR